ncbi:MAG TPA: BNR-4 repeat-containing protein, partial [Tepidisphaeraceae bacterium]
MQVAIICSVIVTFPGLLFSSAALGGDIPASAVHRIPIGMAYANDAVNTSIFRVSSIVSGGGYQFAAYYAPDGSIVVARRELSGDKWDIAPQPFKGNVADAHNDVVL